MFCRLRRDPRSRRYGSWKCPSPCLPPRARPAKGNSDCRRKGDVGTDATTVLRSVPDQGRQTKEDGEGATARRRPREINAARGRIYWLRPRIDAGWPGSLRDFPVLTTRSPFLVSSTLRMDTSLSMKLPT